MTVPDRLCSLTASPFFNANAPEVRVAVSGVEYTGRVVEYCISAGWARVLKFGPDGKPIKSVRGGHPSIQWKHGNVAVWRKSDPPPAGALLPVQAVPEDSPADHPEAMGEAEC